MQITTPELGKLVDLHVATHHTDEELPLDNCVLHYLSGTGVNLTNMKDEVWRLIEEVHPDIIHINCCWTPLCSYFAIWAKDFNVAQCIHIPIIYTPHGMLEPWIIAHNYWTRKVPATLIYQRRALKYADVIHSTAMSEMKNLRKLGWNKNIKVIPNCVDVTNIEIKQSWNKTRKILFLSRVHEKKGINFIIDAVAQLKKELEDYTISIVGLGEERYVKSLVSMAENKGVSNIVKFEGPVFGNKKFELYREADMFILPTHSENFGIVVAEALACGTPVITTVGTPWNELNEHECGWWIEIGVKPLVESLRDFLSKSDEDLKAMGMRGRQLIEDKYSCESIAQQFYDLYSSVMNRKLTVLHYIPRIDRRSGGLGSFMKVMSKELGDRCRLHVLTHRESDNLSLENCTVSYLSSMWPTFITKREFKAVLDKIKPDVVHVNTCWLPLSAYTVMWAKEFGYRVILTPHGMLDTLIIRHNYWTRKMPAILSYQRSAVSKADVVHSTSKHEKRILYRLGWNKNIHIIPNGVNIDMVSSKDWCMSGKKILYLGRIHPQKGINHLIEAVAIIQNALRNGGYTVEIVGMGDESYINKLKSMVTDNHIDDIVTIMGPVFEEQKYELYKKASVFVLPSYSESFGLVVAESLACETPVITTKGTPWEDICGTYNPESNAIEGRCGWWIEKGSKPLAEALMSFIGTSQDELVTMGRNGRRLIKEKFSTKKVADELISIYNNMKVWK